MKATLEDLRDFETERCKYEPINSAMEEELLHYINENAFDKDERGNILSHAMERITMRNCKRLFNEFCDKILLCKCSFSINVRILLGDNVPSFMMSVTIITPSETLFHIIYKSSHIIRVEEINNKTKIVKEYTGMHGTILPETYVQDVINEHLKKAAADDSHKCISCGHKDVCKIFEKYYNEGLNESKCQHWVSQ